MDAVLTKFNLRLLHPPPLHDLYEFSLKHLSLIRPEKTKYKTRELQSFEAVLKLLPWVPEGFFSLLFPAKIERQIRDRDERFRYKKLEFALPLILNQSFLVGLFLWRHQRKTYSCFTLTLTFIHF